MSNHSHEMLARQLLDEPPSAWPEELTALRVAVQPMPASLRLRLNQIAASQEAEERAQVEAEPGTARPRREPLRLPRRSFRPLAAAAAIAVLVMAGAIYQFRFRQGAGNGSDGLVATITFADGDLHSGQRRLARGDVLHTGEELTAGPRALAVLSARSGETEAKLRVRPESHLQMEILRTDLVQARLHRGAILASLSHDTPSQKPAPGLALTTSTSEGQVTGTVFSWEADSAGDTTLTTFEGTVVFRRRWDALEDLPDELIARSELLSEARNIFRSATAPVPAGSQSTIAASDFQRRLRIIPTFDRLLNEPPMQQLRMQGPNRVAPSEASQGQRDAALKAIEAAFPTPTDRSAILQLVREAFGQPPEVRSISEPELRTRRESLEAASEAERDARYSELRKSDQAMDRETFRREATKALGKPPQEILLKNGEKIYGTIFGENGRYKVYTATGITMLSPEEIEEILFDQ